MSAPLTISINDCAVVPVTQNRDARGCLYEIFRESWPHSFRAVQWNACVSRSGVVRGVHAHVDYDEFYTLPQGRVILGLHDIRRSSTSFGQSVQFEWLHQDACAIVIPRGVAHVIYFCEDSVLAFGLSNPWRAEYDAVGCKWDDPELGFNLPLKPIRSARDSTSGSYNEMILEFEELARRFEAEQLPTHSAYPG
jgi:dTDP-4-dehydrorhamnose 3,5-epimerase